MLGEYCLDTVRLVVQLQSIMIAGSYVTFFFLARTFYSYGGYHLRVTEWRAFRRLLKVCVSTKIWYPSSYIPFRKEEQRSA